MTRTGLAFFGLGESLGRVRPASQVSQCDPIKGPSGPATRR